MIHEFIEILKEASIALGIDKIREKLAEKGAEKFSTFVEKKLSADHRAVLMRFIKSLEAYGTSGERAAKNLFYWHYLRQHELPKLYGSGERYDAIADDEFETELSKLYFSFEDSKTGFVDEMERIEMFKFLGNLEPQEFDAMLEFLCHDVALQWMKKGWRVIEAGWEKINAALKPGNDRMKDWIDEYRSRTGSTGIW